ncbi:retrotransposon protein, putative, ty1-copia subclass, partial [Tanacetum coccineum]
ASGSHGLFEMTGGDKGFEIIQDKDTQPSENTSKEHNEVAPIEILVELPPNGRTIRSKWLFKKKTDMDGNVHTFKARLVAKGYTQTYGVDYGETFTPVTDNRAIRILLAMAAFYDYEIWQMDVKTAFLNGHLSEDVYMVQPEGFVDPKHPNKCFSMKDLGEAAYILGIKIIRDRSKRLIALSQSAYLEKILKKFRMENSKNGYTPMMEKPDYRKSQGAKTPTKVQRMQRVPYALAIGSIMYAVRCTRPDVAFANTKDMVLVYGAKPKDEGVEAVVGNQVVLGVVVAAAEVGQQGHHVASFETKKWS